MYQPTGPGNWNRSQSFSSPSGEMQQYGGHGVPPVPPYGQKSSMYGYQVESQPPRIMKTADMQPRNPGIRTRSPWQGSFNRPSQYPPCEQSKIQPDYHKKNQTEYPPVYSGMDSMHGSRSHIGMNMMGGDSLHALPQRTGNILSGDRMYGVDYRGMQNPGSHYNYQPTAAQQNPVSYPQYHMGQSPRAAGSYPQPVQSHPQISQYQRTYAPNTPSYGVRAERYPAQNADPAMLYPMKASSARPSNISQTPPRTAASYLTHYNDGNSPYGQMTPRMPSPMHESGTQSRTGLPTSSMKSGGKPDNFSLDNFLDDSSVTGGSFMQQLEDVAPNPMSRNSSSFPQSIKSHERNTIGSPVSGMYPRPMDAPRVRHPGEQQVASMAPIYNQQGPRHDRVQVPGSDSTKAYPPVLMPATSMNSASSNVHPHLMHSPPVQNHPSQSAVYPHSNHNILSSPRSLYTQGTIGSAPTHQSPRSMLRTVSHQRFPSPNRISNQGNAIPATAYRHTTAVPVNERAQLIETPLSQQCVLPPDANSAPKISGVSQSHLYPGYKNPETLPEQPVVRNVAEEHQPPLVQNITDESVDRSSASDQDLKVPQPNMVSPAVALNKPSTGTSGLRELALDSKLATQDLAPNSSQSLNENASDLATSSLDGGDVPQRQEDPVPPPISTEISHDGKGDETEENVPGRSVSQDAAKPILETENSDFQVSDGNLAAVEKESAKPEEELLQDGDKSTDKSVNQACHPPCGGTPSVDEKFSISVNSGGLEENLGSLTSLPPNSTATIVNNEKSSDQEAPKSAMGYSSTDLYPRTSQIQQFPRPPIARYPPPQMPGNSLRAGMSSHATFHSPNAQPVSQTHPPEHVLPQQAPRGIRCQGYAQAPGSQRYQQPGNITYPEQHSISIHGPSARFPAGYQRPGFGSAHNRFGYNDAAPRHQLYENGSHPRPYFKHDQNFGIQAPQLRPQQFHGPVPGQMNAYPRPLDPNIRPGWHNSRLPVVNPDMMHSHGVPVSVAGKDSTKSEKTAKKVKAPKDNDGAPKSKKERVKKNNDKVENSSKSSGIKSDSPGETTSKTTQNMERKRKKPPATFKIKKKKRKKGDDADDFDGLVPDLDESLVEKRRSVRNVKRKQYTENFDCQLSDEDSNNEVDVNYPIKSKDIPMMDVSKEDDVMIVEKILDTRIRKVPKSDEGKQNETKEAKTDDQEYDDTKSETADEAGKSDLVKEQSTNKTDPDSPEYDEVEEFFVKYKNYSYLHCEWKSKDEFEDKRVDGKIKRYKTKLASMPEYLKAEISEPFNPDYVEVERVLDVAEDDNKEKDEKHYFIKWCSLPYEDCTWEAEADVPRGKISEFESRCKYLPSDHVMELPEKKSFRKLGPADGIFLNNNQLRDYQLEGVNWLLFNWHNRRNCILADEMGLGKTVQSITFLQKVFDHGIEGPFLIVAPLSTICNWQREFASWTNMNAIIYHGSQTSRDMIRTYEFLCRDENLDEMPGKYKMHAVITTYEMIVLESSHLQDIEWRCSIIDEAHRLKNQSCKLADSLRSMQLDFKVLLTGTPLQNNVEELFALLNFLQPEVFSSPTAFVAEFGDMKNNSQVEKIQELLKPMMLRRLKEDVEKSLAPKEETIIEVELTAIQKQYYRAIIERNFEFLSKGTATGNVPNLMNTMMELRKCCNHPYLIKGAEDKILADQESSSDSSLKLMIQSSGKLVLIDKLLPRLKSAGHKVLIFSQMVRCLDILEDYMVQSQYSYERIDGGIRGSDRQAAIDRFSKPDSEKFVFLLCTRAGGLGINLTAADTVIIFDSDWNPQNDLQAQARCHRIGQRKTVKIYRLITRNSYEREMFEKASLKLGLDKAILQSMRSDDTNQNNQPALSKQEVEDLLKLGAYGAIMDEDDDSKKFCEEDIDQILLRRTQTIKIAPGQKGSTFSKASFVSEEKEGSEISLNDPDFWEKWAKKADLDIDRLKNNKLIIEQPRRRKQTRRFGGHTQDVEVLAEIGSDSDSDYDEKVQSRRQKRKSKNKNWAKKDFFRVEKHMLTFGWGRWKYMQEKGSLPSQMKPKDIETVCRAMIMYCLKFYSGDDKIKAFMWDLITPQNYPSIVASSNPEGVSASPSSRGRKGKTNKDETSMNYEAISGQWIKEVDVNALLHEEGFKKHLQNHCNKILLRIRMLQFLKTEILGAVSDDAEKKTETEELSLPDIAFEKFVPGWDYGCDKNLLYGIHKHGFGKYSLIRADPKLCFLEKFGMPDEKSLSDDIEDLEDDDNKDPEYKPAKLNLSEYSEFEQDSPATAPSSPASVDSAVNPTKSSSKEEVDKTKESHSDSPKQETQPEKSESSSQDDKIAETLWQDDGSDTPTWPTAGELNMRVRRLVARFQKQHKLMRSRLMGIDQNLGKSRVRDSSKEKMHWTRREESDFYRTVSTFGVEYSKQGMMWTRFRHLAKLEKKSDRSLEMYYLAFKAMCERACGHKAPLPEEIANISVMRITEERASRTLYRIELLNRIRLDVLQDKNLDKHLKLCEPSPDLPAWWKVCHHDKELLLGMNKHGVTRTEVHILNDSSLSFLKSMLEYEQVQTMKLSSKRASSPDKQMETSKKHDDANQECEDEKNVKPSEESSGVKNQSSTDAPEKFTKKSELVSNEETARLLNNMYSTLKWPKDRVLIQRVEHICYCVIHGKWPISRLQEEATFQKSFAMPTISPNLLKALPKSPGPRSAVGNSTKLLMDAEGQGTPLDEATSRIFEIIASHSAIPDDSKNLYKSKKSSQSSSLPIQKLPVSSKESKDVRSHLKEESDALMNLLASSKINETLQLLMKGDLPQRELAEKMLFSQLEHVASMTQPKQEAVSTTTKPEVSPSSTEVPQTPLLDPKTKAAKLPVKKKTPKSKTGFISPAVLPPESRIPVYNPSEKKKLVGDEAPLNKDLADWLKSHPGFVVDYKTLRQQLNEESGKTQQQQTDSTTPAPTESKSSLKHPSKTVVEQAKTEKRPSSRERNQDRRPGSGVDTKVKSYAGQDLSHPLDSHSLQSIINQSLMNPQAGLLNAMYGGSPEMNALIASGMVPGLPPFLGDMFKDQSFLQPSSSSTSSSSRSSHSKQKGQSHSQKTPANQMPDMASLLALSSNMQNPADLAMLSALFSGYSNPLVGSEDEMRNQLKRLLEKSPSSLPLDPKALAMCGMDVPSFFPGMPGMANPLLYGMYGSPELAAMPDILQQLHMTSLLENEYAKIKDTNMSAMQDLLNTQNSLMASLNFNFSNQDLQKIIRSQEAMQPSMTSLGKSSNSQIAGFDENLQAVYQQLHSSSLPKEFSESKKEKDADKKTSPSDGETPMDLRRSQLQKKS